MHRSDLANDLGVHDEGAKEVWFSQPLVNKQFSSPDAGIYKGTMHQYKGSLIV